MKIVIAPDSFKESMTAKEACKSIEKGMISIFPNAEFIKVPMADGGEGTTQSLVDATNGKIYTVQTTGPLGEKVNSYFGILGDNKTAIIEMATTSGLELVPRSKRNPFYTTTYGTGELIKKALDMKVSTILIGIGGSATNDAGAGMIQALGGKLLDKSGKEISYGGIELSKIDRIDLSSLDPRLQHTKIIAACDVQNPMTGRTGASYIFAPQKGANLEMVQQLDENLKYFAQKIREYVGIDVEHIPGSGAAGGLGGGLMAFLSAELKKGIDIVVEYSQLADKMKGASWVITGEGSIDAQTRFGKTPYGVAQIAQKYNIPTIALAGNVSDDIDILYQYGFHSIFSIMPGVQSLEKALENGKKNLEMTASNIARLLSLLQ